MTFKLNEALASTGPSSTEARPAAPTDRKAHVPLEHRLLLSKVDQSLCVYSEESITGIMIDQNVYWTCFVGVILFRVT